MDSIIEEFEGKFMVKTLTIFESNYWIWSLRPNQVTLGSGILSLKRECLTLGEVTLDEFKDLGEIIKVIEKTLKVSFSYNIMNYFLLMMVDKQVHYHVIPRYIDPIMKLDTTWNDTAWPGIPNLAGQPLDDEKLNEIVFLLKRAIAEH